MDDYDTPGNYYITSSTTAQSLKNAPFTTAFTLKVEHANGTAYPRQIFTEFSSGIKVWRLKGSSGWNEFIDNTVFQIQDSVVGDSEEAIDEFYDNYSKSFNSNTYYLGRISHTVAHSILGGGTFSLEGFKTTNSYEWQIVTSYKSSGGITRFCRSKINGEWTTWTPR